VVALKVEHGWPWLGSIQLGELLGAWWGRAQGYLSHPTSLSRWPLSSETRLIDALDTIQLQHTPSPHTV
jgi:hypothetical protein